MSLVEKGVEELKKIPPWGYVLGLGAGVAGFIWWKNNNSSSSSTDTSGVPADNSATVIPDPGTQPATPPPTTPPPAAPAQQAPPVGGKKPPNKTTTYTVKSGDTLSTIASAESSRGFSTSWEDIYKANTAVIENAARAHGFSSSDDGHWIFPGEVLTIP